MENQYFTSYISLAQRNLGNHQFMARLTRDLPGCGTIVRSPSDTGTPKVLPSFGDDRQ
jgi:hypothetical protein